MRISLAFEVIKTKIFEIAYFPQSPIYRGLCYAAFAKKEMVDPARSLKVSFIETLCAKQGMGFFSLSKGQYISIFHV